jgi:predicted double-glycine peptidase
LIEKQAESTIPKEKENRKVSTPKIKCSKKTRNNSMDIWKRKLQTSKTTHKWKNFSSTGGHYGEESTAQ